MDNLVISMHRPTHQQTHDSHDELAACRAAYASDHRHQADSCDIAKTCPDSGSLVRLADNRLWWPARKRLLRHLSECSACADDYRVMRQAALDMRSVLSTAATSGNRAPGWLPSLTAVFTAQRPMRQVMLAASMLLAVSALMLMTSLSRQHSNDDAMLADRTAQSMPIAAVSAADDVLFRSDFDSSQVADQRNGSAQQEVFADSFGG